MNLKWLFRMAWRDSRGSRAALLLFMSAITVGVAALVSIRSFADSLENVMDDESRGLLGADLALSRSSSFDEPVFALFESLGGEVSTQISFSSMAYFPNREATRLVRVRAIEGGYPFYDSLQTQPEPAAHNYAAGPRALVESSLMIQLRLAPGDPLKLGDLTFTIAGELQRIPGETPSISALGARVFIPQRYVEETGLLKPGSRFRSTAYFYFKDGGVNLDSRLEELQPQLHELRLRAETASSRQASLGNSMANLTRFLSLAGFMALFLGGLGVASAVHLYIKRRIETVSLLRCLGATSRQSFAIYLLQCASLGLIGSLLGILVGFSIQQLLPRLLRDALPVAVEVRFSWAAAAQGLLVGLGISILFSLIPLLSIRRISPLASLRSDVASVSSWKDPLSWVAVLVLALAILGFCLFHSESWQVGVGFFVALFLLFGALWGVARLIMFLAGKVINRRWPYEWRQGLANLHRPNNQTAALILALGLGTFLIATFYLAQHSLLGEIANFQAAGKPNLILFDIQTDQREGVERLLSVQDLPVLQSVPLVTMRLSRVHGQPVGELLQDDEIQRWILQREYRATYRDSLFDTEQLVAGELQEKAAQDDIRISVEEGIASDLGIGIGDSLEFDVQGVPIATTVGSLRRVDWDNFQTNFFVVFPPGALESAPQFHVLVTRTQNPRESALLQRTVVQNFPNVSILDLSQIIDLLEAVLGKIQFVLQFLALFTLVTGPIVLIGTVVAGRYQRMRESVLLRTLGAARSQILKILFLEYFLLAGIASLTGVLLSVAAGWALARFLFEVPFSLAPGMLATTVFCVILLSVVTGMAGNRKAYCLPPSRTLNNPL